MRGKKVFIELSSEHIANIRYGWLKDQYRVLNNRRQNEDSTWNYRLWVGYIKGTVFTFDHPVGWNKEKQGMHPIEGKWLSSQSIQDFIVDDVKDPVNENEVIIINEFKHAARLLEAVTFDTDIVKAIDRASNLIVQSIAMDGKIIICGNGGSMSDAMHFSAELTGRFTKDRRPLPSLVISDAAHLTCVANDYGADKIFSRFITAHAKKDDVIIFITTSGNSENIIQGCIAAAYTGARVIALTGRGGGKLRGMLGQFDCEIAIPDSNDTARIQEMHIKVIHILCKLIERKMNL